MASLAAERRFDHVLVESSGISEPLPVAETFTYRDKATAVSLNDVASLHNLVTVVDAASIFEQLDSMDTLVDRGWHEVEGDERTVAHLLCDQLEVPPCLRSACSAADSLDSLSFTTSHTHPLSIRPPLIPPPRRQRHLPPLLSLRTCSFSIRSTW